ncbi:MAG: T9SS type A sorting domain-containing protein, partial [Candidatus Symbiothrix sp.]|nr:T9SS type A sorting domain-containing protein [Candidatus Symbiothrix sp.]
AGNPNQFTTDWLHIENDLNILNSPAYAHQNGKPVICIWGFGFVGRTNTPQKSLEIINWLKDKGYYVIGGVPTNFRTSSSDSYPGYEEVYKAFDMLSPWTVGRYGNTGGIDNYKTQFLIPDYEYCQENGIDYQPVLFPGFAWSNWNSDKVNEMPRDRGEFLWRQMYNIKESGISSAYIAMFDEYDEGTAILKAADSFFAIPTDQYFLTNSADGTYLSSDFYLRLAGKATRVLKGTDPLTETVTIPYSEGPIWFRTSFEKGFDAIIPTNAAMENAENVSNLKVAPVKSEVFRWGSYAVRYVGKSTMASNAHADFPLFDVNIPVNENTKLGFWLYPLNENGRYVSIDLIMTDGTRFKDVNAVDRHTGISMDPATPRGVIDRWNPNLSDIGQWLNGKTIDKICLSFADAPSTEGFNGYIDDIVITDTNDVLGTDAITSIPQITEGKGREVGIYPTFVEDGVIYLNTKDIRGNTPLELSIVNMQGKLVFKKKLMPGSIHSLSIDKLPGGFYIASVIGENVTTNKKIVVK